ncbi:Fip1 like protein [Cordyceps fumosorosea ARSEF 2679]|uniref:Fip1 like protein n=1 Tax=Cordyceps fumosorosea (strain ARSEF 2679) TaxID=1081104 RepID=A0A162MU27_CORFA|nr:Fip1 like protein [Cordyceps fumosorosea ARSEF 2679]OAA70399.1 Fip1 like protein [Cordyceps fumosorosea ARSEF 2679]
MDMDEDDDIYVPEEPQVDTQQAQPPIATKPAEELEEGEEEDEGGAMDEDDDDSDIDIITERKDGTTAAPPSQAKYSDIRNIPQRSGTKDSPGKPAPVAPAQTEAQTPSSSALQLAAPSADKASAAASKSTVDINANPIYPPVGKPITQVNIDEDNEKPWRRPGTDISDYFNYGFDEFTWALYAAKQESVRGEFGADTFAMNNKKIMDDFSNMMMMGGMGMGGNSNTGAPSMPGMDGMPAEMQQMMQQMMASGMDPSQMDMSQMNQMFSGMQNGGGAAGGAAQSGAGQNFVGGYGGNQAGYGGYNQGAGRGRRGRW